MNDGGPIRALAPGATIGIVGGGQLGRMLAMAAARLGFRTAVLEASADCPAAQVANICIAASYNDRTALRHLAEVSDVLTFEFENVPVDALEAVASTVPVLPPPRALAISQDRLHEKRFLNEIGIATAAFRSVGDADDIRDGLAMFGGEGVLKTRRFGYDGKGQHVFGRERGEDVASVFDGMGGASLILEALVPFEREISVIGARGRDGAVRLYEPAENVHRDGILRRSTVPAQCAAATIAEALGAARRLLEALDYVGVLGLELFVLADGSVLANEFAPRVHNSGHWTEAACSISQFEQHIRAVAGLPLGSAARHSDCVMENLIGGDVDGVPALLADPASLLHLYGKAETRPGRKMGHVTRLGRRVDASSQG